MTLCSMVHSCMCINVFDGVIQVINKQYDFIFRSNLGKKTQRYRQGIQEKEKQLRQLRQKMKALKVNCLGRYY